MPANSILRAVVERLIVIAERGCCIPLILHGKSVKPGVIECVEYAPAELEVLPLSDPPRLRQIHVGRKIPIATNWIARPAFSRVSIVESRPRLRRILKNIRNTIRDRSSSRDGRTGQVRPAHFI